MIRKVLSGVAVALMITVTGAGLAASERPSMASSALSGYISASRMSPLVMDVPAGNTVNGTPLQVWSSVTGVKANEQFTVTANADGTTSIELTANTAKCADVRGYGTADGTPLQVYACNGGVDQKFATLPDGTVEAVNATHIRGVPVVVAIAGTSAVNGARLQIWHANGTSQQYWTLPDGQMPAPAGFSTKVFEDTFSGTTLDSSKWVTHLGAQGSRWNDRGYLPSPYSGDNMPGANNMAMFAPSQVTVNNGVSLNAVRNTNQYASAYPWLSGVITTEGKFSMPTDKPWYLQANAKMPDTSQGMWPAIWFLPGVAGTAFNELDSYEGGWKTAAPNDTMHSDYFSPQGQVQSAYAVGTDLSASYHIYGVAFRPGTSITAYLDGKQVWQVLASHGYTITAEPYEIMLELQVAAGQTSGWHTVTSSGTPSQSMRVAEVQVYTP